MSRNVEVPGSRIEEILSVSPEDWDAVFHLELALRILAVPDKIPGRRGRVSRAPSSGRGRGHGAE